MADSKVVSIRLDSLDEMFLSEIHDIVLDQVGIDASRNIIFKTALKVYRDWLCQDPTRANM